MAFSTLALELSSLSGEKRAREQIADAVTLGARRVRLVDNEAVSSSIATSMADVVCDAGLRWMLDTAGNAALVDALAQCPRRRQHCEGVVVRVRYAGAEQTESTAPVHALACISAAQAYDVPFSLAAHLSPDAARRVDAIAYEAAQLGAEALIFECLSGAGELGGAFTDFGGLAERIDALNGILRIKVHTGASVPRRPLGPECAPFAFESLTIDGSGQARWCERIHGHDLGTPASSLLDVARAAIRLRPSVATQRAQRLSERPDDSPCAACRAALSPPSCKVTPP